MEVGGSGGNKVLQPDKKMSHKKIRSARSDLGPVRIFLPNMFLSGRSAWSFTHLAIAERLRHNRLKFNL